MRAWQLRNPEIASLLNPAFCGVVLHTFIKEYQSRLKQDMPYPLVFLILPIVLNRKLRESLPRTARTRFHVWLQAEPFIKIGLAERVKVLVPITRESLAFLLQRQIVGISARGEITKERSLRGIVTVSSESEDFPAVLEKARVWGAMVARAGDAESIFMTLGLTV
jgi:hypothetical protein